MEKCVWKSLTRSSQSLQCWALLELLRRAAVLLGTGGRKAKTAQTKHGGKERLGRYTDSV